MASLRRPFTLPLTSAPKSIDACFSNDLSQFLCGYDGDELYPKVLATALAPAVMYHAMEMQLFQRVGSGAWRSLTGASGIFVSTDNPISAARDGSVVAKYLGSADPDVLQKGALPYDTHRLLIPHYIPEMLSEDLPPHMVTKGSAVLHCT
ncbi:hypothetical protein IscW_ISCW008351 [Ixodes scapularis]|uniref:Uncharacterized protein n=1 Tax=Ixodes scapularis TaxID=6945 RepID=B7PUY7_IXOSC|nr:hypothetical protein IscW_ISCW008351 [Ixodes scapularis]|eukprot:XP_002406972.1 hypothetical protein IscW_ISCW008351 [Ixodes scapularis]